MLSLEELRAMPGAKRLQRAALITVMIWLAALLAFSAALSAMSENEDRLGDAEKILNAAITVKSYPQQGAVSGKEPVRRLRRAQAVAISSVAQSGDNRQAGAPEQGQSAVVFSVGTCAAGQ